MRRAVEQSPQDPTRANTSASATTAEMMALRPIVLVRAWDPALDARSLPRSAAAPQPPQALFKRRGKRELAGLFAAARRHLVPSLGQNVGELVGIGLGQETGDIVLEEHDAGHVLDHLRLGVRFEPLLADERTDAREVVRAITLRGHDFADAPRVKGLQILAPFQVPRAAGRVARARRGPPLDVLAARRDAQMIGGVVGHGAKRLAHATSINELGGLGPARRPVSLG